MSVEDYCCFCEAVAEMKPKQSWFGGFQFSAKTIRDFVDDQGNRTLCLFDDPVKEVKTERGLIPENEAHAIVVASGPNLTEADIKEIKAHLMKVGKFVQRPKLPSERST